MPCSASLRDTDGVTVLIYDQTCAAEKRRRRKKGEFPDPDKRLFINEEVCEGCGDCGVQSNCLSVEPVETDARAQAPHRSVVVQQGLFLRERLLPELRDGRRRQAEEGRRRRVRSCRARAHASMRCRCPRTHLDAAPYDILVTGVGGTGVVTVGALISMAAHLEGKSASVLDFMGFAQKGGSVLSFVRFAARDEWLNQVRIDTQQADVLLACDMVVGASADALQTVRHGRTRIVVNTHAIPNATFVQNPDANLHADALIDKMRHAAGEERMSTCDAQALATRFLGDTIGANILMLGFAWQLGLVPVSFAAMMRAIELNNVAVQMNQLAFSIGRLAAADPAALETLWQARHAAQAASRCASIRSTQLIAHREAASRGVWRRGVCEALSHAGGCGAPCRSGGDAKGERVTRAVATTFYRLLAVKDEYEVARLHTDPAFRAALEAQFEGVAGKDFGIKFNLAPPTLSTSEARRDSRARRRSANGCGRCSARWRNSADCAARCSIRSADARTPDGTRTRRRLRSHACNARWRSSMRDNAKRSSKLADLHARVRGYGHVKLANLAV